jgi:hypothetical protein
MARKSLTGAKLAAAVYEQVLITYGDAATLSHQVSETVSGDAI